MNLVGMDSALSRLWDILYFSVYRTSLAPPAYKLCSIFISLQYYVWVCGTEGVAENNDARLCASLSCSQTLAIGYGRSRVALGRSNGFKQTPALK